MTAYLPIVLSIACGLCGGALFGASVVKGSWVGTTLGALLMGTGLAVAFAAVS